MQRAVLPFLAVAGLVTCLGVTAKAEGGAGQGPARRVAISPLEVRADLDGDGSPDLIRVAQKEAGYVLTINGVQSEEAGEEKTTEGVEAVDIRGDDGLREVQVVGESAGGYQWSDLYAYDGREISLLGSLTGGLSIPGTGKVYVERWHGSFTTTAGYELRDAPRRLEETPQDLYFVGLTVKVRTSFPIRLQRHRPASEIHVSAGSEVQIVAVDLSGTECGEEQGRPCEVFLIRTSTGVTGWVERWKMEANVEGLSTAG
jgi:hypothetical protein